MELRTSRFRTTIFFLLLLPLSLLLSGCLAKYNPAVGPLYGSAVDWSQVPGWEREQLVSVWPALLRNCQRTARGHTNLRPLCAAAAKVPINNLATKNFIKQYFEFRALNSRWWQPPALVTGYYVPVIKGSLKASSDYRYPLYRPPADLVYLDLGPDPRLPTMGRLLDHRVVPYPGRASINAADNAPGQRLLAGNEIVWLADPIERFFLQIQGSGRIELANGSSLAVHNAANNGRPYHSIGKELIARGAMTASKVTLYSLKQWLKDHPRQRQALLNSNPRYIFFKSRIIDHNWSPKGAFGLPLTAGRSLAVDPDNIPLGSLLWLDTSLPDQSGQRYQHLMLAQDRGAAIKGRLRIDLFWGQGNAAERLAATMKQAGRLYLLVPKPSAIGPD